MEMRSVETHCPSGFSEACPEGQSCYGGLSCNVKDLMEEAEAAAEESGGSGGGLMYDKHDPKRKNFCGECNELMPCCISLFDLI